MPYSRVTRTEFGADALAYLMGNGKGHNGEEVRNLGIATVNMLPDSVVPFRKQMQICWDKADPRHKIQVDRFVISFPKGELDRDKPEDVGLALVIGCDFAREIAPDSQSVIAAQGDGKGGMLHLHIDINDCRMLDGKGIDSLSYAHFHFQKIVDRICSQHFDLVKEKAAPERVNRTVQGLREKNEKIRAENALEIKRAAEEGRPVDEKKLKTEHYIWQDDLKAIIKNAAKGASDEENFAHRLRLSGVELVPYKSKDGMSSYLHPATDKQPAYYLYELTEIKKFQGKIPTNLRSKSFKLGLNYQPEAVELLFKRQEGKQNPSKESQRQTIATEPAIPMPKPKAAPKPDTKKLKEDENERVMVEAKKVAVSYLLPLMREIYGWEEEPLMMGGKLGLTDDLDEIERQHQATAETFKQFTAWRQICKKELAKKHKKLPQIYFKDEATGFVSVHRPNLEKQFREFLDRRDHPEKYAVHKKQGNTQEQRNPEALQVKTPDNQEMPTLSKGDLMRQEVAFQRTALAREAEKIDARKLQRQAEEHDEPEYP